jgi:preprotein translocase subunit YajC
MTELISILGLVAMAPPGEGEPTSLFGSPIFLFVIIIVMFYFILYMPEKKRKQQREQMLKSLERGDEVLTSGGIYGRITALTDKVATIEVAPNTRIRVARPQVSKVAADEGGDGGSKGSGKGDKKSKKDK